MVTALLFGAGFGTTVVTASDSCAVNVNRRKQRERSGRSSNVLLFSVASVSSCSKNWVGVLWAVDRRGDLVHLLLRSDLLARTRLRRIREAFGRSTLRQTPNQWPKGPSSRIGARSISWAILTACFIHPIHLVRNRPEFETRSDWIGRLSDQQGACVGKVLRR